jgi:hypothetical protein
MAQRVNIALKDGWQPSGPMIHGMSEFHQPMVKYEEAEDGFQTFHERMD